MANGPWPRPRERRPTAVHAGEGTASTAYSVAVIPLFPGIIRRSIEASQARRVASTRADRILRGSSALGAAVEVWSDVASSRGFGLRTDDAGPVLHGDLRSGGAFEMAVCSDSEGQYTTLAATRLPAPLVGSVVVRPHEPWTRLLAFLVRPPSDLPKELTSVFFVRSSATAATTVLTPKVQALLALVSDRLPQVQATGEDVLLVLEGVELLHERVEAILDAFDTLSPIATGPYRR